MGTYCDPIRLAEWYEPELESWHEAEIEKVRIRRLAQAFADILASVQPHKVKGSLEERFREHAEKWERETMHLSSTTKRVLHPSYQIIMGMGPDVVPLLLRDLQQNRRAWFWALYHLTQENPIDPADAGNIDKMVAAWVRWGKRKGLL